MWNVPKQLRQLTLVALTFASLAAGVEARAEDDTAVVQKLAHGEVNWTTKTITATGSGAANTKDASVAVARLNAERAAKLDALRNILETLQGVQVNGRRSVADMMSNGEIRSKIQGLAQGFKVVDTRYYSDGSVDLVVQMPIDANVTSTLFSGVPAPRKGRKVSISGTAEATGLVINARGLGLLPSMAPRIVDESGTEVYGAALVSEEGLAQGGIAGYAKDVSTATADARVGAKPAVVKALRLADRSKTDIVIANADAAKLRAPDTDLSFLSEGRVIIVVD